MTQDEEVQQIFLLQPLMWMQLLGGLGSMGSGAHTPNETVNLKDLRSAFTGRTAILIYRLIQ